jgi:hypothetical protein
MSHERQYENVAVAAAMEEHVSSTSAISRRTLLVVGTTVVASPVGGLHG